MTDETGFRFYRVAYSYEHTGWCVYEQDQTSLFYVDGPWTTETEAQAEMSLLNKQQGLQLGAHND